MSRATTTYQKALLLYLAAQKHLHAMSEEALRRIAENKRTKDVRLDLGNCLIVGNFPSEVMRELMKLEWLEELSLSSEYFDPDLGVWIMTDFYENSNRIDSLPDELSSLKNLKKLFVGKRVGQSYLSDLSPLKDLRNLQVLYVANTLISDLSPIKNLQNLKILNITDTRVSDLSPLKGFRHLQELLASYTSVSDLSPLKDLQNLRELYLRHTDVVDLSPIIPLIRKGITVKWSALRDGGIQLFECPLTNPPPEIVKQGNEAILQYFAEREKQGVEKIYEAKLVLIGDGRAGKTTLRDKLKNPAAPLPPEDAATKGVEIDIAKYQFDGDHGQPFRVNIWDFAGQEKYQPIHQFFYTHRALYVLVENAREQKTDFDFWLQTAELCSGGSPVLIVHNEFGDQNRGLFQLGDYQGRYPGGWLKDDARVNFADNRGLAELERKIQYHIQQLPHVGEELPKIWAEIRRHLSELSQHKPYLTLEAYFVLCREAGIPEEERALHLSQYLHILGAMLHYADNDLLGQFVILQNEWATDAAYKILDDEKITFETKGRFHRADLERIWTRPDYARMRPQLLELMKKFKLCYQVRNLDLFIAPQLLPATPPEGYEWEPKEDLRLTLQYEFMPKGLLTRFTVNRHTDIAEGQMLAWNSGVVLEWNNTRAEVTEQYRVNKGTIEIRVQGADGKGLMSIVDKAFDELHDEFKGIKVEKMVPCNCSVCKTATAPHFYKLSNLNFRREKRQATVECEISFENVNVIGLIENVFQSGNPAIEMLRQGKFREALEMLLLTHPEAANLSARYETARREHLSGTISFEEFDKVQNQVMAGVMDLIR